MFFEFIEAKIDLLSKSIFVSFLYVFMLNIWIKEKTRKDSSSLILIYKLVVSSKVNYFANPTLSAIVFNTSFATPCPT